MDKFVDNARSAGDIATCRRGTTADYDDAGSMLPASDGTLVSPIILEADYDDNWGDEVDLSATATATLTFGSKTVTYASDISGVLAANDWIYVSGENTREFAYEVASVSTVTATLFLPYKGNEAGSGKTTFNMQSAPRWHQPADSFQVDLDVDNYWEFRGLWFSSTHSLGIVELNSNVGVAFRDCIFEGNGASDIGLKFSDEACAAFLNKCRFYNCAIGIGQGSGVGSAWGVARDCLIDGNNATSSKGIRLTEGQDFTFIECEFKNHATGDISMVTTADSRWTSYNLRLQNCILSSTTELDLINDSGPLSEVFSEDHNGTIGDSRNYNALSSSESVPTYQSETTKVRAGGATTSIKVTPSTDVGNVWEHTRIKLFEIPIYATTDAKTYTVYFAFDDNTDWTADPTAAELWIELEAWGHASNNFRKITKSTGTLTSDDNDFDKTLTVTVTPAQAGIAYLRCYYTKTLEGGNSNIFYVDPIPTVA